MTALQAITRNQSGLRDSLTKPQARATLNALELAVKRYHDSGYLVPAANGLNDVVMNSPRVKALLTLASVSTMKAASGGYTANGRTIGLYLALALKSAGFASIHRPAGEKSSLRITAEGRQWLMLHGPQKPAAKSFCEVDDE